jgi:SAM-dependent methyltransferase
VIKRQLLVALFALPLLVHAQSWAWDDGTTPYVQSPMDVVDRMLWLAQPKAGEYLIDLGSGDGRIVVEAAKRYGARGLGVDLEPRLVELATENARKAGVGHLAKFAVQDLFELDFSRADIVSAYLLPEVNLKIVPKLLKMRPGTRIVTHDYHMGPCPYDEMIELPVAEKMVGPLGRSRAYLFVVPADARGVWRGRIPDHGGEWQFSIKQEYQVLEITGHAGGREVAVRGSRLRGEELRMVVTGIVGNRATNQIFRGTIKGDRIEGEVAISEGDETRTLPWTATRASR